MKGARNGQMQPRRDGWRACKPLFDVAAGALDGIGERRAAGVAVQQVPCAMPALHWYIQQAHGLASLDALERLCAAVGIGLGDLFKETDTQRGSAQLVKRAEQMEVVRVGTKYGHTYRLLAYDRGPRKLFEPFFIEMDKKSESYPRFAHPGTEFIYMLQGRMEYRFGDRTYLVEPGDAFTFSGDVVHGPEKLLDDRIRFLAIIFYNS